ncbi:g9003 [Coccomyxa viridis]|uniref:G9003 protein n=1 Tax=Coccomyxa viridis TaxID=1274662 RepID=A0ABP1G1S8_9CHLO
MNLSGEDQQTDAEMPHATLLQMIEEEKTSDDGINKLKAFLATYLGRIKETDLTMRIGEHQIPAFDVWMAVLRNGGNEAVTDNKLWATIGRSVTSPPQGMTDLSHRVKSFYQKRLLPAEMELRGAPESAVAAAAAAGASKGSRGRGMKRGGGRASIGNRKRPAKAVPAGANLIGKRILVLRTPPDSDPEWHIGTIEDWLGEKHSVRFDSGDELQEVLLAEGAAGWRNATKRHEDEAEHFGGVVANPDSRKSRGSQMEADQDTSNQKSQSQATLEDGGVIIQETEAYKVREVNENGKRSFEAYIMTPGTTKDDIKVKCWPEGRLRIRAEPSAQTEPWPKQVPVEHNIQLPCAVDPHSASALLTLHGLLFVKVIPASSTAPRGLPKAPKKPPSAPSSAQQGAQPAQPPSSSLAPSKPAEGNEASGDVQADVASMEA